MRVALVGYGTIGKVIVNYIMAGGIPDVQLVAVADNRDCEDLRRVGERGIPVVEDAALLLKFPFDLVIEAAGQEVVRTYAEVFLRAGKHMMILSPGALADPSLLVNLTRLARDQGVRIIVPSGAIGGLDAIKAASIGRIDEIIINIIKPPQSLEGAPYVIRNHIDLYAFRTPTKIFEGSASEAAREFPRNLNVSVALSLAGIGPEKTHVILVVDPNETRNIHEITARGEFGEARFAVAALPSPDNPMTSHIASLSAIATLKQFASSLQIGT